MDCRISRSLAIFVAAAVLATAAISANAAYRADEVLVKYKPGKSALVLSRAAKAGGQSVRHIEQIRTHVVRLQKGLSVEETVRKLRSDPNVEYAGPNHIVKICLEPNDDWFFFLEILYMQWGLYSDSYPDAGIDATRAWDITTGGTDVTIAIVDTGVQTDHEDLWAKIVPGRNVITGAPDPNDPYDDHGHGTFTAGVAAAMTNNITGVAGVSWGAKIMPIKALDAEGYGTEADAAAGIIWAADHGAKVINMSFGGYDDTIAERDACAYAWSKGCLLVAASGNDGVADAFYPASYDQVIAVGASNESMQRCTAADWGAGGSNYGNYLDVMAPGNGIMSTYWPNEYTLASGTSAAAPFVAGTAALLMSYYPSWTNHSIGTQIRTTCKDMGAAGWDIYTGWGLVSAYRALTETVQEITTISEVKGADLGEPVSLRGVVLSTSSGEITNRLYVQSANRANGVLLYFSGAVPSGLADGDFVDVSGSVGLVSGEVAITGPTVTKRTDLANSKPSALGMNHKTIGGGAFDSQVGVVDQYSYPREMAQGINNIGLLVRTAGKVRQVGTDWFYLDDGSKLDDGTGNNGIYVYVGTSIVRPNTGKNVIVTGISSCEILPGSPVARRVLRPRRQSDIRVL